MQVTSIGVSESAFSLTYDKLNHVLTGNTLFSVMVGDLGDEPSNSFYVNYSVDEPFFKLMPSGGVDAETPKLVRLSIDTLLFNLGIGNYTFYITFTSFYASDVVIPIYLSVVETEDPGGGGTTERDYKLKYFFENEPRNGEVYRCEIHMDKFDGTPKEIEGKAEYKFQNKKDHFDPIVASNLSLSLLATKELGLQDLYSEDEQTYKVFLKKNDQVIFIGFLKPDGINEDYVYDKWMLDVDVFDGLSTLKNLSFTNDNGIRFSGKYTGLNIVTTCLKKTGLDLPININCAVMYETGPGSLSAFETFFLNTERYYQNGSDPMDCESVIKSILQLFNATLIQHNGEWYIYRTIDLEIPTVTFNKFYNNLYQSTFIISPLVEIGSQINDFEIFHCNSNQRKSISPSVQAYRVTYQYGNASSVFSNSALELAGGGLDIPGWTVHNVDGMVYRNEDGEGLTSKTYTGSDDAPLIALNQSIDINSGAVIKMIIRFANVGTNSVGLRFSLGVNGKYFNTDDEQWQGSGHINFIANYSFEGFYPGSGIKICKGLGDATYEMTVKAPEDGNLSLTVFRDRHELGAGDFIIRSINVIPNDSGNIKGRDFTAQRLKRISTVTKPNTTLYNGDSVSDLFVGTIYKNDADTPTDKWFRLNDPNGSSTGLRELLSLNAEDNLRMSPRPMIIFEGDVCGYLPFISYIKIDGHDGNVFQPTAYSFNTEKGILRLTSREFSSEYIQKDIDFRVDAKNNYGNETKVTIV